MLLQWITHSPPQDGRRLNRFSLKEPSEDPPGRIQNDDYFPQGNDLEEDVGSDDTSYMPESKRLPEPRTRKNPIRDFSDEDQNNFRPSSIPEF